MYWLKRMERHVQRFFLDVLQLFFYHFQENWTAMSTLRGHLQDVIGLSWSPCSQFLVSCSTDNTAIVFDVKKGKDKLVKTLYQKIVLTIKKWDKENQTQIHTLFLRNDDTFSRFYNYFQQPRLNKTARYPGLRICNSNVCKFIVDFQSKK